MANLKLNIFKIQEDYSYDEVIQEIENKINNMDNIVKLEDTITHGLNEYKINYIYALNKNDLDDVDWKVKIEKLFSKENSYIEKDKEYIKKKSYSNYGYLLITNGKNIYLIAFGRSTNSIGKLIDLDFGLEFASRSINVNEIELQSSKFFALAKNKSIVEYNKINFSTSIGESVDYLIGTLEENPPHLAIKSLCQYIDNKVEFNCSIKIIVKEEQVNLDNLCTIIYNIDTVQEKYNPKVRIPKVNIIKSNEVELLQRLEMKLNKMLLSEKSYQENIAISFYNLKNSQFKFSDNVGEFQIYSGRKKTEKLENITIQDIVKFMKENDIYEIEKVKVSIKNSSGFCEQETAKELIYCTINFEDDNNYYCLDNGRWYKYNDKYLEIVRDEFKKLEVNFDEKYNYNEKEVNDFATKNEEDILREFRSKEDKKPYKEFKYNYKLSKKFGFKLCDRKIVNNFEVCDLYIDNRELAHVKIGGPQDFIKCIEQSRMGFIEYKSEKKKVKEILGINNVDTLTLILITSNENVDKNKDIQYFKSLNFKIKLVEWYNFVKENNLEPKIIIGKIEE